MKCFFILINLSFIIDIALCYNILIAVPFPSRSHFISFSKLFSYLAENGHNVTVISHYPNKNPPPNYTDINIGGLDILWADMAKFTDFKKIAIDRISNYLIVPELHVQGLKFCEAALKSKAVQAFLQEVNNFDVIIFEDMYTECMWYLAQKYECPVIKFASHTLATWNMKPMGNPYSSAYVTNVYKPWDDGMSFLWRLENTLLNLFHVLYYDNVVMPGQIEVTKNNVPLEEKTFDNRVYNASLVLLNTHFTYNGPRPLVPNMIEVGGIHIGTPRLLNKDLEKWIREAKHGVIYFCLGSVINGHSMLPEKRKAFINAFKRLPQRILWKWENETMEGKPDNVMIGKWLPQFDILSHPNVKAFITHGGLLGTMEAVHSGVPMMVMPQFGDQHTNAKALESVGGGVTLYMRNANEETIYQSLKKILEPSFQASAKELSARFRDRPLPPLETATYWVEYVARHRGAHFLKTAAVNMPFYQYYLLDVIGFVLAILLTIIYLLYLFLKYVLRKIGILSAKNAKLKKS